MALQYATTQKTKATKTKSKAVKATVSEETCVTYVQKRLKLEKAKAKLAGLEAEVVALESELRAYADLAVAPADGLTLEAGGYMVRLGAKGQQCVGFDTEAIRAALDEATFNALITFTVEDLKKYLPMKTVDKVTSYERKRRRVITIEKVETA